jgi:hypothetical protein
VDLELLIYQYSLQDAILCINLKLFQGDSSCSVFAENAIFFKKYIILLTPEDFEQKEIF